MGLPTQPPDHEAGVLHRGHSGLVVFGNDIHTMNTTTTAPTGQITLDFTTTLTIHTPAAPPPQADEAPDRPSREDRLAAAHAILASGLSDVRDDPEAMARFLLFRSKFHEYSIGNTVLVWMQNPSARFVKGYRAWQAVGRQVRKGETGITILAPVLRRPTKAEIAAGADPDTRTAVAFRTASVFDYAQTDTVTDEALVYTPPSPRLDAGDPAGLIARLEHVAMFSLGYRVVYGETGYADGSCSFALKTIAVNHMLSPADRAAVLTHEIAHALGHSPEVRTEGTSPTTAQRELQAEGAAFLALHALGLDSSRASLPYLKGWAGGEDAALLAELAAIDRIASDLLALVEATAA